jgi:hypothetical protein
MIVYQTEQSLSNRLRVSVLIPSLATDTLPRDAKPARRSVAAVVLAEG